VQICESLIDLNAHVREIDAQLQPEVVFDKSPQRISIAQVHALVPPVSLNAERPCIDESLFRPT